MTDVQLFLGFCIDDVWKQQFEKVNANLSNYFIRENSDYLCTITYNNEDFLGKFIGNTSCLDSIKLIQENIISIALKLVPDYNFLSNPVVLIAVHQII